MSKIKNYVVFILLCSFLLNSGCVTKNKQNDLTRTIYFYSTSKAVTLNYKFDKTQYLHKKMFRKSDSSNWWITEITSLAPIRFSFTDETDKKYNLGGTMGDYPKDPAEDFSTSAKSIWVKNNLIYNYNPDENKPENDVVVLSLNMHTYQEKNQNLKFERIVNAIKTLNPNIVVLQECAQNKDAKIVGTHFGQTIKADNMALIVTQILNLNEKGGNKYDYYWDWSHYGWDIWEEGTAILTKDKILKKESKYITKSHKKTFWKSRNVTMVQIEIPDVGKINVFSAHLGWWDDKEEPFKYMFNNLNRWIVDESKTADGSIVCGDFNVVAGSKGYNYLLNTGNYIDSYYAVNPNGFKDSTIGGKIDGWEKGDALGKRIDYMFILKGGIFKPVLAQRIFTEKSFGRVSDHCGVYFYLQKK